MADESWHEVARIAHDALNLANKRGDQLFDIMLPFDGLDMPRIRTRAEAMYCGDEIDRAIGSSIIIVLNLIAELQFYRKQAQDGK